MSDDPRLGAEELEALWREAWRLARRACHSTLVRLRAGQGGFYDADDLHQDLFLGFRKLALAWGARRPRTPESELWSAWRRYLWHGGARAYRRRPQRLWAGVEQALSPECLSMDYPNETMDAAWGVSLPAEVARQLIQQDEAPVVLERQETREALLAALQTLPARQRCLLELVELQGRPVSEAARLLGLPQGQPAYQRLYRARLALARALRGALSPDHG